MRGTFRLDCWGGQVAVLLRAARQFLGAEEGGNAGVAGEVLIGEAWINAQFGQQCRRPPARMGSTHLHDGFAHTHRKRAQRPGAGAAHLRAKANASLVLTRATPCAHRPHGAAECRRNRLSSLCPAAARSVMSSRS